MTFIIGMKCSDGLVMCADSLESDGITKRYRDKLEKIVIGNEWGICWGGAGNAEVVDKFSDKLEQILGNDSYDRHKTELRIESCLGFVRQQYPKEPISIVVGLFGRPLLKDKGKKPFLGVPEYHLYRGSSQTACISPERHFHAAGMDVTLATFLLNWTFQPYVNVREGAKIAVFVTEVMKEYADGVGGETSAWTYSHPLGTSWSPLLLTEIDAILTECPTWQAGSQIANLWQSKNPVSLPPGVNFRDLVMKTRPRTNKARKATRRSASQRSGGQQ